MEERDPGSRSPGGPLPTLRGTDGSRSGLAITSSAGSRSSTASGSPLPPISRGAAAPSDAGEPAALGRSFAVLKVTDVVESMGFTATSENTVSVASDTAETESTTTIKSTASKHDRGYIEPIETLDLSGLYWNANPVRRRIGRMVRHRCFDRFIITAIIVNCGFLAAYDPLGGDDSPRNKALDTAELVFGVIFFLEMILKMYGFGLKIYFSDAWNWLDFFIVVTGVLTIGNVSGSNLSSLRTFRLLRPLRLVTSLPGMRVLVRALLQALPALLNVVVLMAFFFVIFGIVGLESWMGVMKQRCHDGTAWNPDDLEADRLCSMTPLEGRQCGVGETCVKSPMNINYGFTSFDNMPVALLTIFQSITLEGWVNIMYALQESQGDLVIPYFVILVIFGSFFIINLTLAVLHAAFGESTSTEMILAEQEEERSIQSRLSSHLERIARAASSNLAQLSVVVKERTWWGNVVDHCTDLVNTNWFGGFIAGSIVLNTLLLASEHHGMHPDFVRFLDVTNIIFIFIFGLEVLLKLIGMSFAEWRSDSWNVFDAVVVASSLIEVAFDAQAGFSAFRAFRILRVIKLARHWTSLRNLLETIAKSLASLASLTLLVGVFMFICSLLGMQLFGGKLDFPGEERPRSHFDNLFDAGVTVFIILTGENWNEIMWNGMRGTDFTAALYFVPVVIIGNYFLLNVFVAILISNFDHDPSTASPTTTATATVGIKSGQRASITSSPSAGAPHESRLKALKRQATVEKMIGVLAETEHLEKSASIESIREEMAHAVGVDSSGSSGEDTPQSRRGSAIRAPGTLDASDSDAPARMRAPSPLPRRLMKRLGSGRSDNSMASVKPFRRKSDKTAEAESSDDSSRPPPPPPPKVVIADSRIVTRDHAAAARRVHRRMRRQAALMRERRRTPSSVAAESRLTPRTRQRRRTVWESSSEEDDVAPSTGAFGLPRLQMEAVTGPSGSGNVSPSVASSLSARSSLPTSRSVQSSVRRHRKNELIKTGRFEDPNEKKERRYKRLYGMSLWLLKPKHPFRLKMQRVVESNGFENAILFLIMASSVILVFDNPNDDPNSKKSQILDDLDIFFTVMFLLEVIVKAIVYGFALTKRAYLRDSWNVLDFTVVATAVMAIVFKDVDFGFFKSLRLLRFLRPLRVISRYPGMKIVVNAIFQSIPAIRDVGFITVLFWLIFGILGVQLFAGKFYYCNDDSIKLQDDCIGTYVDESGAVVAREWLNPPDNFDWIGNAMLTLFGMATLEGWPTTMYRGVDATAVGQQPERDANPAVALFFCGFIIVGAFFVLNLFVGAIINNFHTMKERLNASAFLTKAQRERMARVMAFAKPRRRFPRPDSKLRGSLYDLSYSHPFEYGIMFGIVLNILLMSMQHDGMTDAFAATLDIMNKVFTCIFLGEAVIKMIGMGSNYFRDGWNRFDFLIVCGSVAGDSLHFGISTNVFRFFRIARIFRLVETAKNLQTLLKTLWISLISILNVGSLLLLLFWIYAVVGVDFFSNVKYGEYINEHANFSTFGMAMITLFRVITGEDWNGIMYDCMIQPPFCEPELGNCGYPIVAVFYFLSFVIAGSFVLLNLFIAIILENFNDEESELNSDNLRSFVEVWAMYDPGATRYVPAQLWPEIMRAVEPPLGLGPDVPGSTLLRVIAELDLPLHRGSVQFFEAVLALTKRALKADIPEHALRALMAKRFPSYLPKSFDVLTVHPNSSRLRASLGVPGKPMSSDMLSSPHRLSVADLMAAELLQRAWRRYQMRKVRRATPDLFARAESPASVPVSSVLEPPLSSLAETQDEEQQSNDATATRATASISVADAGAEKSSGEPATAEEEDDLAPLPVPPLAEIENRNRGYSTLSTSDVPMDVNFGESATSQSPLIADGGDDDAVAAAVMASLDAAGGQDCVPGYVPDDDQ